MSTQFKASVGILFSNFQWLKSMKQKYLAMSPLEKWQFVRDTHSFALKCIGVDFTDPNYKMGVLTMFPIFLQAIYYICLVYTLIYYHNDPFKALIATPALGFYVPGFILLVIVFTPSKRNSARHGYEYVAEHIYSHSEISAEHHKLCDKMAISLLFSAIRVMVMQLFSLLLMALAPLYKTLFTDDKEMMIPVILPFIDPDSQNGFYFNLAHQLIILCGGIFIVPGSELVSCVVANNFTVIAYVLKKSVLKCSESLEKEKSFTKKHVDQLRNIVLQILDFNRYVEEAYELLYWKFFIHPMIAMYANSVALFSYLMYHWIAGIGAAACLYIQILIICDLGQTTENANLIILDGLNQFSYDLLPPKKRAVFQMLLIRMHKGSNIKMGPMSELNYGSATNCTKMIYTYVMAMKRMMQ